MSVDVGTSLARIQGYTMIGCLKIDILVSVNWIREIGGREG